MTDAKQAWNDVGDRFSSLGKRLSDNFRETGTDGADAGETQRKLEETAKEVGAQINRAFDALGATFDEAGKAIRRTVSSDDTSAPPTNGPDDPPTTPPTTDA